MNDTRDKILDVADDLVQRVGLNAMSYTHISDAVGIRKASIHHHFPRKEDLVNYSGAAKSPLVTGIVRLLMVKVLHLRSYEN